MFRHAEPHIVKKNPVRAQCKLKTVMRKLSAGQERAGLNGRAEFLTILPPQGGLVAFTRFNFAAGEFPLSPKIAARFPPGNKKPLALNGYSRNGTLYLRHGGYKNSAWGKRKCSSAAPSSAKPAIFL